MARKVGISPGARRAAAALAKSVAACISPGPAGTTIVKFTAEAQKAGPATPTGAAVTAAGVNILTFAKQFNARTRRIVPGTPLPTVLTVNPDKTFTFAVRTPTVAWLLKKASCIGDEKLNNYHSVSLKHVYEIAKLKLRDEHLSHISHKDMCVGVIGTAMTLGITVLR